MSAAAPQEIVVYIHGVSPEPDGRSHAADYERMHRGIAGHNPAWPKRFLGIEWGLNDYSCAECDYELLTDAQRLLGERLFPSLSLDSDFSINPGRMILNNLRPLLYYGFGDMFYYASADGKRTVRNTVAQQLCRYIESETGWDHPISMTLIGHSAGSVIAFDLAFFLFFAGHDAEYNFLPHDDPAFDDARRIRSLADKNLLRIRRLITFGSPIAMLTFRSDAVVKILAAGGALNPRDYGFVQNISGEVELPGPRWLNIWDRDDPIAWPVQPLMQVDADAESPVADIYIDVSDSISKSHSEYWRSERVYKAIAKRW